MPGGVAGDAEANLRAPMPIAIETSAARDKEAQQELRAGSALRCYLAPRARWDPVPRLARSLSLICCECSPPGSEMPHNALPTLPAPSVRAMSASDKVPTSRLSRSSTGRRRTYVLRDLAEIVILEAVFHLLAHDLAYRGVRPLAGAHSTNGDVAIGDHSD